MRWRRSTRALRRFPLRLASRLAIARRPGHKLRASHLAMNAVPRSIDCCFDCYFYFDCDVDCCFDCSSPYSYIASGWIQTLAVRHRRTVNGHAMLLGATFQVTEIKRLVSYPLKRECALRGCERSARFAGVPLTMPAKSPIETQNAACMFWCLKAGGRRPVARDARSIRRVTACVAPYN